MAKQKWTVEIEVDDCWVEDGFDLTAGRMQDIMCKALPFARYSEIDCRVVSAPDPDTVATLQGYKSAEHRTQMAKVGR